jgi:drug/metabolite transporter (DMT)-like permease
VLSVILALAASGAWGVSDFLGGLKSRQLALLSVLTLSQPLGLVAVGVLLLVRGTPPPTADFVPFGMLAGVTGLVGLAAFYQAMAIGTISIVAPIGATSAVVPVVYGLATGERAAPVQVLGIGLALLGVVLASQPQQAHAARDARQAALSVGLAVVAALAFGAFFIALHQASQQDVLWPAFVQRGTSSLLLLLTAAWLRPTLRVGWPHGPGLIGVGLLDVAANILYAAASTTGLVSLAAMLSSLYPVVTVLLARVVLHERLSRLQQGGVASALLGIALIAVP